MTVTLHKTAGRDLHAAKPQVRPRWRLGQKAVQASRPIHVFRKTAGQKPHGCFELHVISQPFTFSVKPQVTIHTAYHTAVTRSPLTFSSALRECRET
jgi:hypothetical protein